MSYNTDNKLLKPYDDKLEKSMQSAYHTQEALSPTKSKN
jgi:hypothetical protein